MHFRAQRRVIVLLACFTLFSSSPAWAEDQESLPDTLVEISNKLKIYDFDTAILLINEAADQEHPKYQLIRALQYALGIGVAIDSDLSTKHARLAAEHEDWEAAQFLAWRAMADKEDEAGLKLAMDWRSKLQEWKAADPSPPVIPTTLLYPDHSSYRPIYQWVSNWNYEQAKAGDPVAQFNMFVILFEGRGIQSDMVKAVHWLMRAANAKNGPAARWLSLCYRIGLLTKENPGLAQKYLQIAAEAGDAQSQTELGGKLIRGRDVEKDVETGLMWIKKAADQDYPDAMEDLAEYYSDGDLVEQDYASAFGLYTKLVSMGHTDSLYDLAWMWFYGQGVDADPTQGIRLFEEAAENGNAGAALRLAKIYLNGWKTDADPQRAKFWADRAIELGHDYAPYILGRLHEEGLLGEVDLEEAFYQYELAAREGDRLSQEKLGHMLLSGFGIDRDLEEAFSWFQLAAEQGLRSARQKVLLMEGVGWGTTQKPESLVRYLEEKNGKDMPEYAKKRFLDQALSSPKTDPYYGQNIRPVVDLTGTELEGMQVRDMTTQQKVLYMQLYDEAVETAKLNMHTPDPAEEAEIRESMQKSWERVVKEAIDKAGKRSTPAQGWLQPPPPYPDIMRRLKIEESLNVVLTISKDGYVTAHSFDQEPLPHFKDAVEFILPKWRFIPAIRNGKPVESKARIPIPFKMR